jgi:hypothetical protein
MAEKSKKEEGGGLGVGTGLLAGAAAIAAGYYFYASKDAKKHRQIAAKWAADLKDDVIKEAKKLKKIDKEALLGAIDKASEIYHTGKNIDRTDVAEAVKELKDNWQELAKEMKTNTRALIKKSKESSKKVVHKAKARKASN